MNSEIDAGPPSKCDAPDCHREPTRLVRFISESDGVSDRERWLCRPCWAMAREGNKWPGGNVRTHVEVGERV